MMNIKKRRIPKDVYVVTIYFSGPADNLPEPIITVFDNKEAAECYMSVETKLRAGEEMTCRPILDKASVFHTFIYKEYPAADESASQS